MSFRCRDGHDSDDADYCSVCGLEIDAAAPSAGAGAPAARPNPGGASESGSAVPSASSPPVQSPPGLGGQGGAPPQTCPSCGEPRADPAARFCEVCRFDFVAGSPGPPPMATQQVAVSLPVAPPPPAVDPAAPPATAPPASPSGARLWEAVVTVDPTLDTDPDPDAPCPTDEPERVFPLDLAETLIGRRDDRRDIHPEIPLRDPGASRRHAKLVRRADGAIAVLDLASTNGTSVNGEALTAGVPRVLADGDAVTVGRWTRIVVRGRS